MHDISLTEAALRSIKSTRGTNVVPLHELLGRNGVCRHRAVLFKLVCDELCEQPQHDSLRCRLVRGDYGVQQAGGGHAWNVVRVGETLYLCDVMHDPGKLYTEDSDKANEYRRLSGGGVHGGGIGGGSVPIPEGLGRGEGGIRWEEITLGKRLGSGGFGTVYAAQWRHDEVAVKQINAANLQRGQAQEEMRQELKLLLNLRHRHIVNCYGGGYGDQLFIVTELMERGSLADCLRLPSKEFAWDGLGRRALLDASKGLLYLHEMKPAPLAHFDIKPLNVLVSSANVAKLADVGLTRRMLKTMTGPMGFTPGYAAPEVRLL